MMNEKEFNSKLEKCTDEKDITQLADELFEEIIVDLDIVTAKKFVQQLLDKGFNPSAHLEEDDDWISINHLAYAYNDEMFEIVRMIFDNYSVPDEFYSFIGSKVDYNYYNVPYVVKLYLLASSYIWESEETYIKMSENLYEEMFDVSAQYTSLMPKYKKLELTPAIFREVEKYDICVEMLTQEVGMQNRVIHIFDKESRIEVAIID